MKNQGLYHLLRTHITLNEENKCIVKNKSENILIICYTPRLFSYVFKSQINTRAFIFYGFLKTSRLRKVCVSESPFRL